MAFRSAEESRRFSSGRDCDEVWGEIDIRGGKWQSDTARAFLLFLASEERSSNPFDGLGTGEVIRAGNVLYRLISLSPDSRDQRLAA